VIPPALSVLLQLVLPIVIRSIAKGQGSITHSKLDRAVLGRYTGFLIISQFFIFSLLGVFFNLISEVVTEIGDNKSFGTILKSLNNLPKQVQTTYVQQSSYWLTWFPLRGFSAFFDLAQLVKLLWISVKTRLFGRTPREIKEWTKPPEFDYPVYYSNSLFMLSVGLVSRNFEN
jgi:calcium permeable stress-gated cation channel